MALSDFPKLASGFFQFIKGKMDWHEPLNKNFEEQASRNSDFADSLKKISSEMEAFTNRIAPPGMVAMFAKTAPPIGWLKANGAMVSRTDYAELFNAIGTIFGAGDGITTFNLPDLRGEFIRGFDDGRGVDAGIELGDKRVSSYKSHFHSFSGWVAGSGATYFNELSDSQGGSWGGAGGVIGFGGGSWTNGSGSTNPSKVRIADSGGGDTYPRYMALLACIKY